MPSTSTSADQRARDAMDTSSADRLRAAPRLPVYLTPFVGREREIAQAVELLQHRDVRLLTLTGPGGIGKTRLALRLATELTTTFGRNIAFVPLSTITEADHVLPTIARAIDIPDFGDRPYADVLKSSLRARRLLLLLDNFEQVIDAAALITDLLAHCPDLTVIVTSRVVLRVQGEQELAVPPLDTPERGPGRTWNIAPLAELSTYDAIALFVQRARSIQHGFSLTDDNALAVAEICTRLDGLPLAIELAAARIKILTPSALLTRLANRLQVLTSGARDQPERLRTMRNAIAWSYDLLGPADQTLFQALSVFAYDFTLEAAEAIVDHDEIPGDTLDGIAALVDSSLLRETDELDGERRFRMLATVREFALEQLAASGREAATRRRHADWCVALVERAEPEFGGPNVVHWLNAMEREHDDVGQALAWLLGQGDVETCMRITWAIWIFWFFRCYFREARGWLDQVLAQLPATSSSIHARTLLIAGTFTEAVGDFAEATEKLEAGRRMALEIGDTACVGMAMLALGDVADNTGDYERAERYLREAVELLRETNIQVWLVLALAFLGSLAQRRGDEDAAQSLTHEALDLSQQIGFRWGFAISLNRLGRLARNRDDNAQAAERFRESLAIWRELGDLWRISRALVDLADVASANHHFEHAARLLGAAQAINERIGASESFVDDTARQRALAGTSAALDAEVFSGAWQAGHSMSWDEAIAEATTPDLAGRASPRQSAAAPEGFGLTAREMDVLRLLAAGNSDRQIAERLFISRRTAQGHVAGIFNKLGVNSRTAAATAAVQAGLVELKPTSLA